MERQRTGWSPLARKMAGKSDPEQSGYWLPLWMHALDTAGVFQRLVQNWIPQRSNSRRRNSCNLHDIWA